MGGERASKMIACQPSTSAIPPMATARRSPRSSSRINGHSAPFSARSANARLTASKEIGSDVYHTERGTGLPSTAVAAEPLALGAEEAVGCCSSASPACSSAHSASPYSSFTRCSAPELSSVFLSLLTTPRVCRCEAKMGATTAFWKAISKSERFWGVSKTAVPPTRADASPSRESTSRRQSARSSSAVPVRRDSDSQSARTQPFKKATGAGPTSLHTASSERAAQSPPPSLSAAVARTLAAAAAAEVAGALPRAAPLPPPPPSSPAMPLASASASAAAAARRASSARLSSSRSTSAVVSSARGKKSALILASPVTEGRSNPSTAPSAFLLTAPCSTLLPAAAVAITLTVDMPVMCASASATLRSPALTLSSNSSVVPKRVTPSTAVWSVPPICAPHAGHFATCVGMVH
mmetsp:Transcript_34594/g.86312  ORF Transcript_34594/g.86312 Transcript_34594/m.86312 type:complete len:409 (-) Transcript_34594:3031-4257(-)